MARGINRWFRLSVRALALAASFAACGGLKSGLVNIVGTGGSAGSSSAGGGAAGTSAGAAGAQCTARSPCANGPDQGVCNDGACSACADPKGDPACVAAYGDGNLCVGGACVKAQCRTAADCGDAGQSCVNNQCAGCKSDGDCTSPSTICDTKSGACVTNASCGSAVNGAACPVNAADLCCATSGVCTAVSCCGTDPCKSSPTLAANDGKCKSGQCVLNTCAAPTGTTRYVDFSAPAGGSGSKTCPFGGLSAAFDDLGATGGTVVVKSGGKQTALATLLVGSGIQIYGSDKNFDACTKATCADSTQWPIITTGNHRFMNFLTPGMRELHYLTIQGAGKATATTSGLYLSAATVLLEHVDVSGYQYGEYVDTGGTANIGGGVHLHDNHVGLFVSDGGASPGGAAAVAPLMTGDPTNFNNNDTGIVCRGNGSLQISGPPWSMAVPGIISADNNGGAGVSWSSTLATPLGTIDGLQASGNGADMTQTQHDGISIFAHSMVKIRNSYLHDNTGNGLHIAANGTIAADELTGIDLGNGVAAGAGRNTFAVNALAGLCIDSGPATTAATSGVTTLNADGNIFGTSAGDCTKGGTFTRAMACAAGVDYSGACAKVTSLSNCTPSNTCQ